MYTAAPGGYGEQVIQTVRRHGDVGRVGPVWPC
jgi:hypothetical protein